MNPIATEKDGHPFLVEGGSTEQIGTTKGQVVNVKSEIKGGVAKFPNKKSAYTSVEITGGTPQIMVAEENTLVSLKLGDKIKIDGVPLEGK